MEARDARYVLNAMKRNTAATVQRELRNILRSMTRINALYEKKSSPINDCFKNHKTDIRKLSVTKEGQNLESNPFSKHGIDNIKISILKIVPNKTE